jgi:hypothetical protein
MDLLIMRTKMSSLALKLNKLVSLRTVVDATYDTEIANIKRCEDNCLKQVFIALDVMMLYNSPLDYLQ